MRRRRKKNPLPLLALGVILVGGALVAAMGVAIAGQKKFKIVAPSASLLPAIANVFPVGAPVLLTFDVGGVRETLPVQIVGRDTGGGALVYAGTLLSAGREAGMPAAGEMVRFTPDLIQSGALAQAS